MKRIAIFCDGTWNRSDSAEPTNVMLLARAVARSHRGVTQQVIYIAGVGSGVGSFRLAQEADRWLGGLTGTGLTRNIEEAYRQLAFNYEPGDEVSIFGFSRGAYTARSLANLIRYAGIPTAEHFHRIPEALRLYQKRRKGDGPDAVPLLEFRLGFSPQIATSEAETAFRLARGTAEPVDYRLAYLGVWDTVGALGVPNRMLIGRYINARFAFHDCNLSRHVLAARHAVAVDERRRTFAPTLWQNLDRLNEAREDRPYRQEWFPGDHGSVGGGGDVRGLSAAALGWIAEGAALAGLGFGDSRLSALCRVADHAASLACSSAPPNLLTRVLRLSSGDRFLPPDLGTPSDFCRRRLDDPALGYRPGAIRHQPRG